MVSFQCTEESQTLSHIFFQNPLSTSPRFAIQSNYAGCLKEAQGKLGEIPKKIFWLRDNTILYYTFSVTHSENTLTSSPVRTLLALCNSETLYYYGNFSQGEFFSLPLALLIAFSSLSLVSQSTYLHSCNSPPITHAVAAS
jgi:hypothetical protein